MKNAQNKNYFLSLDIGTDSVGYAATDENYNLLKFHGEPVWGVTIFDQASLKAKRRAFRTARRRLDRRQQRIDLLQQLFAKEIGKIDPRFFIRLEESTLWPEDKSDPKDKFTLFNESGFTDKEYHKKYPTIHHLIYDLMESKEPHDVRLVYLACAWLVAHRGHFLFNFNVETAKDITDFGKTYAEFLNYFENNGGLPWSKSSVDTAKLSEILKKETGVNQKYRELSELIYRGQPSRDVSEEFPFSQEGILKLLAGGTYKLSDLLGEENSNELEAEISLNSDEETEFNEGDNIITALRKLYYWAPLTKILNGKDSISVAKIDRYDQHKKDLVFLKHIIKTYLPEEKYNEVFRRTDKDNYAAYSHHTDEPHAGKWRRKNKEDFSKFILGIIKEIKPKETDKIQFDDMKERLKARKFMPKQKDGDNCTIPQQLYFLELKEILKNASEYLPFLNEADDEGISTKSKIESIFSFKIRYFVGPLNERSDKAWFKRHDNMEKEKIFPWNFEKIVDLEASEYAFIEKMRNRCTYFSWERVLPKDSLAYHKFEVLNEINNLKINGEKISVELKQEIYNEIFMKNSKVTRKKIEDFLITKTLLEQNNRSALTGIDITIKSNLMPQRAFKKLIDSHTLTEKEAEEIIARSTYAENKSRLDTWLKNNFPKIKDEDREHICKIKIKDFGRLSHKFLCEIQGVNQETGEQCTILGALWNTNYNLMEITESDKFTFKEEIQKIRNEHYSEKEPTLEEKLNEMYISNAVKRPIYRALDIIKDITKAFGKPAKIFIETTRGGTKDQKGKRTKSRREQILESYEICRREADNLQQELEHLRQQLEQKSDNELQSDKLFFYFMQLGRCMYTGRAIINIEDYDIDHIYPQSYVKDDSIDNRVLVESRINKDIKQNKYPISAEIRNEMTSFWNHLKKIKSISDEKFYRLTRSTPFTEDEKRGFINRQLVVTSQAVKAIKTLLEEKKFSGTEIVCCKASLVSEFRKKFNLLKSRLFNDLHHATDAYLNIVVGNVYSMKFTKNFDVNTDYSVKIETLFNPQKPFICNGKVVWSKEMLTKAKETAVQNTALFTQFAFFRKSEKQRGLFDQQLLPAAPNLIPRKKDMPTEKYGGYNKAGVMFFIPVKYKIEKKQDIMIMSVELLHGKHFIADKDFAQQYSFSRLKQILGKEVNEISFPLGMRPWKINTVLSLDGFKICISGSASGGKCLSAQPIMQFSADKFWQFYLKKLEMFVEKCAKNPKYIYSEEYDKISTEKNIELYDLYLDKLENSVYSKRINAPSKTLTDGRTAFIALDIKEQSKTLLNIQQVFCRMTGGCDLTSIGGVGKAAATVSFSAIVSNWKKNYSDIRIIDSSASGLWEKKSENLLELL